MRKLLAIAALSTASLVATGGIAGADTGSTAGAKAKVDCTKATARVATAEQHVAGAKTKLAEVQAKVDALRAAGKTKAADKLAGRVNKANQKVSAFEAKLATAKTKVAAACPAG